ncbi:MAG: hypothetical protein ABSH47_19425 [Bryobacteraceae bacterium]
MEVTTAEKEKTDRKRTTKAEGDDTEGRLTPRLKIAKLLQRLEEKLEEETPKASLGDFIRLVQLEKELADEETPREIKVTWVESQVTSESVR